MRKDEMNCGKHSKDSKNQLGILELKYRWSYSVYGRNDGSGSRASGAGRCFLCYNRVRWSGPLVEPFGPQAIREDAGHSDRRIEVPGIYLQPYLQCGREYRGCGSGAQSNCVDLPLESGKSLCPARFCSFQCLRG